MFNILLFGQLGFEPVALSIYHGTATYIYIHSMYTCVYIYITGLPAIPHKAVAEVSKIGNYGRGKLS
jgi:hypothetical protein